MSLTQILIASTVVTLGLFPTLANAQKADAIKPGETYNSEIPTTAKPMTPIERDKEVLAIGLDGGIFAYNYPPNAYNAKVSITLKAGQSISISASVIGSGRKVSLMLIDPTGKLLARTDPAFAPKNISLSVEEVNATGDYIISLWTDKVGPFKLTTKGPDVEEEEESEEKIKAKIARLEQELAAAKANLKAMRPKSGIKKK